MTVPPLGSLDWGDLRRMLPVSQKWGYDRGQPVDRYYIEGFLADHAADISGSVLEIMTPAYTRQFGGDGVTRVDVLDINPHNAEATLRGDLTDAATLAPLTYDCIVLTQTLPVIYDVRAVIRNCYAALAPGGTLLVTAPCVCRFSPHPEDHWRLTRASLQRLLSEETTSPDVVVELRGNLVTSIAFLVGLASVELTQEELTHQDDDYPVVVCGRAVRPA